MARKRPWKNRDVLIKRDSKGKNVDIAIFKNDRMGKRWVYSNFYFWRKMKHHFKKVHKFKSKGYSYSVYVEI